MTQTGNIGKLTPEIIDKIFKDANKNAYDKKVSKDISIHHLNQCKARMGKLKRKWTGDALREVVIMECMAIVDQKINKIKNG